MLVPCKDVGGVGATVFQHQTAGFAARSFHRERVKRLHVLRAHERAFDEAEICHDKPTTDGEKSRPSRLRPSVTGYADDLSIRDTMRPWGFKHRLAETHFSSPEAEKICAGRVDYLVRSG